MDYLIEYDESNPISIEKYAQRLIGKTFADVCNQDDLDKSIVVHETSDYETSHENKKRKGGLGEIIEERFFHYQCNNDSRPDFYKAGVELKVTPYKVNKNGTLVAKERLIITMIDYFSVIEETFESSHMWNKAKQVIIDGLQIEQRNGKNYNNFPNASENPVCHVRPHAQNAQDTYELPDGRQYPKQCFWLNNHYILSQLKGEFKEG